MIIAPGNFNRAHNYSQNYGIINIITRFAKCTYRIVNNSAVLILAILMLFIIYKIRMVESNKSTIWYAELARKNPEWLIWIIGIIVSTYSMLAAPTQPARAFTYPVILMVVLFISLIDKVYTYIGNFLLCVSLIVLLAFSSTVAFDAYVDINNIYVHNKKIINDIISARDNGITDVEVEMPPIPMTRYGIKIDLSDDAKYYFNIYYALYYDVNTVYVKD